MCDGPGPGKALSRFVLPMNPLDNPRSIPALERGKARVREAATRPQESHGVLKPNSNPVTFTSASTQTLGTKPQDVAPGIPVLVGWPQEHRPAVGEARVVMLALHVEYRPAGTPSPG